ncbi:unnamed protein product [Linum trigynum]|uniref:Uncharacterized protein n=1 Tax=Linum trigynum TaxID=586398 RepID=A0AAV2FDS1_9ROSI
MEAQDRCREFEGSGCELHEEGAMEKQRVSSVGSRSQCKLTVRKIAAATYESQPRSQPANCSFPKAETAASQDLGLAIEDPARDLYPVWLRTSPPSDASK